MIFLSKVVEASSNISSDAVLGAVAGIIGVIIGWLLSVLTDAIKNKVGKLAVSVVRSWGYDQEYNDDGCYDSIKIGAVVLINNNKNVVGCVYDWKVNVCVNEKKYRFDIYNIHAQDDKVVDVITVQPKETRQVILEASIPFKTFEMFYDKYDNTKNEAYSGVGKVKKIESIEIIYKCNFSKEEHIVHSDKFVIAK